MLYPNQDKLDREGTGGMSTQQHTKMREDMVRKGLIKPFKAKEHSLTDK